MAINKSAKALQPCFAIIAVRLRPLGPGVGASASSEFRTYIQMIKNLISNIIIIKFNQPKGNYCKKEKEPNGIIVTTGFIARQLSMMLISITYN